MIATAGPFLKCRHASKLGHPHDQRIVQQARSLQILQQRGRWLIENRCVDLVLRLQRFMTVPVPNPFTHRVRTIEQLHKPHSPLQQSTCEQTVPPETGFDRIAVEYSIQRLCFLTFLRQIRNFCRSKLQASSQFVTGDPRRKAGLPGMLLQVTCVQPFQKTERR